MNSCNSFSWTHLLLFQLLVQHSLFEDNHAAKILSAERPIHQIYVSALWRQECHEGQTPCTNPGGWQAQGDFSAPCTIPGGWQAQVSLPCDKNQAFCMPFYQYLMWASQLTQRADRSRCTTGETELLYFRGKKPHVLLLDHINLQLRYGHV